MPGTINGIGTHYYGKSNLQQRPGICSQCGSKTNLSSYDTRLWFVVVFIPIIPLGRKRVTDACPACRRHFVSELRQWQTAKQLETSGALEQYRSSPTPENAIAAHRQLLIFQETTEALELQKQMLEKFPDNAKIHIYLGQSLVFLGKLTEAEPLFARALELRPDLPEARVAVAEGYIRNGQLDRARQLLDFLEKPGAAQLYSLQPLEHLAIAFQRASRHTEALELFGKLLESLPAIAEHAGFRKMVKTSEKALGKQPTILPKAKFSLKRLFSTPRVPGAASPALTWRSLAIVGICLLLVLIGFLLANEHTRHHRELYFVNGLASPMQAEVTGFGKVRIGRGVTSITLPEGHYRAKISGSIQQEIDFDIRSSYFGRWFDKTVWVINPGSAAVLVREQAHYSKNPQPSSYTFYYGEPFYVFSGIDYPFKDLPRTVQVSSSASESVLSRLERSSFEPTKTFFYLISQKRIGEAYRYAEWHLQRNPGDEEMVKAYAESGTDQASRIKTFLVAGLTNRPVEITWHRAYQNQLLNTPEAGSLLPIYKNMLLSEPTNSALLYLYGRIIGDHVLGSFYFEEARKADPNNPYPLYAIAYDLSSTGNWTSAKAMLDRVIELRPNDSEMLQLWETACVGTEQALVAEKLFAERLRREPSDLFSVLRLSDALVSEGKTNEAEQVVHSYTLSFSKAQGQHLGVIAKENLLYSTARFAELEQISRNDHSNYGQTAIFWALIEQNRLQEAINIYSPDKAKDPIDCLIVSLAYRLAGQLAEAQRWHDSTLKILDGGGADSNLAAGLLKGEIRPDSLALGKIVWPARAKALLLADLSLIHPENRRELSAAARRINVEHAFPYHLIQRATVVP